MLNSTIKLIIVIAVAFVVIGFCIKKFKLFDSSTEEYNIILDKNSDFDQATCYMNGNRPFIIDPRGGSSFGGSTAHCVMTGGPVNWIKPIWELPISDPRNPAYYNQFPSERSHF